MKTKHVIIAGVPRAGKTTICSKLANSLQYQHLDMDAITLAFEHAYPETGAGHTDKWRFIETSKHLITFLESLAMNHNYDKLSYGLVMDLYHITPKDYKNYIKEEQCAIYFLGYPYISVEQKLKEIRKFDTIFDWTNKLSDEKIKEHVATYIAISKWLKEECEKYTLPFIDISQNREQVIEEVVNRILEN